MTNEEWDQWADNIEKRVTRFFKLITTLFGALVLTVLGVLAGWQQIKSAQTTLQREVKTVKTEAGEAKLDAEDAKEKVNRVEQNTLANNARLDAAGAPPADEVVP